MALPKRRHSSSRTKKRRSHDALKQKSLSICPQCSELKLPHYICPHCGYYKGKELVKIEEI